MREAVDNAEALLIPADVARWAEKIARILLSTLWTAAHLNWAKYETISDPIKPLDPVTNRGLVHS